MTTPPASAERRRTCEVCGGTDSFEVKITPDHQVVLCADHAAIVAQRLDEMVTRLRAQHCDAAVLQGRRLRDGEAMHVIRGWARDAGYPVSTSGSIAPRIIAAYREAKAPALR